VLAVEREVQWRRDAFEEANRNHAEFIGRVTADLEAYDEKTAAVEETLQRLLEQYREQKDSTFKSIETSAAELRSDLELAIKTVADRDDDAHMQLLTLGDKFRKEQVRVSNSIAALDARMTEVVNDMHREPSTLNETTEALALDFATRLGVALEEERGLRSASQLSVEQQLCSLRDTLEGETRKHSTFACEMVAALEAHDRKAAAVEETLERLLEHDREQKDSMVKSSETTIAVCRSDLEAAIKAVMDKGDDTLRRLGNASDERRKAEESFENNLAALDARLAEAVLAVEREVQWRRDAFEEANRNHAEFIGRVTADLEAYDEKTAAVEETLQRLLEQYREQKDSTFKSIETSAAELRSDLELAIKTVADRDDDAHMQLLTLGDKFRKEQVRVSNSIAALDARMTEVVNDMHREPSTLNETTEALALDFATRLGVALEEERGLRSASQLSVEQQLCSLRDTLEGETRKHSTFACEMVAALEAHDRKAAAVEETLERLLEHDREQKDSMVKSSETTIAVWRSDLEAAIKAVTDKGDDTLRRLGNASDERRKAEESFENNLAALDARLAEVVLAVEREVQGLRDALKEDTENHSLFTGRVMADLEAHGQKAAAAEEMLERLHEQVREEKDSTLKSIETSVAALRSDLEHSINTVAERGDDTHSQLRTLGGDRCKADESIANRLAALDARMTEVVNDLHREPNTDNQPVEALSLDFATKVGVVLEEERALRTSSQASVEHELNCLRDSFEEERRKHSTFTCEVMAALGVHDQKAVDVEATLERLLEHVQEQKDSTLKSMSDLESSIKAVADRGDEACRQLRSVGDERRRAEKNTVKNLSAEDCRTRHWVETALASLRHDLGVEAASRRNDIDSLSKTVMVESCERASGDRDTLDAVRRELLERFARDDVARNEFSVELRTDLDEVRRQARDDLQRLLQALGVDNLMASNAEKDRALADLRADLDSEVRARREHNARLDSAIKKVGASLSRVLESETRGHLAGAASTSDLASRAKLAVRGHSVYSVSARDASPRAEPMGRRVQELSEAVDKEREARVLGLSEARQQLEGCRQELAAETARRVEDYAALRRGLECIIKASPQSPRPDCIIKSRPF